MEAYGKRLAAIGFLLFVALWIAGVVRSFTLTDSDVPDLSIPISSGSYSLLKEDDRSQLRTASNIVQIGLTQAPLPQVLEQEHVNKIQVYEKTAHLISGTTAFAEDEVRIRAAIQEQAAVVRNERSTGVTLDRRLSIQIAVHPDLFESLLHDLKRIGTLASILVQQQDRTGEFRKLHAQRLSLRKHQEAILKLRDANKLSVEEALKLEQKIQEMEKESQAIGVQLGDLLGKDPSYNLFLTLEETQVGGRQDRTFTVGRRLGSALLWAMQWWFVVAFCVALIAGVGVSIATLRSGTKPPPEQSPPATTGV